MPPTPPATTFSPSLSYWQIGRERAIATAAPVFLTMPTATYQPDDKPSWLQDQSLRNSYVKTYDLQQGPIWAEHTVPTSPAYGDTIGLPVYGLMGDYVTTGTAASPNSTLSGGVAAGVTSVTVTSGTGFLANQWIQIDVGQNAEVVQILSVSTNVLTLTTNTPTRFSHLTGVAVTNTTSPYSHQFALLGPGSSTGLTEPPSMTVNHNTGIPGAANHNAVQYLYGKFHELTFAWSAASKFFEWDGKMTSYSHAYPSASPVAAFSGTRALPSWEMVQTIAGSQVNNIPDGSVTLSREIDVVPTADGVQNPYGMFLGGIDATFKLTFNPALDETALNYMLANTRPTLNFTVSNGLSGANLVSFAIAAQLGGFKGAPLKAYKTRFGFDVSGELIGNSTNIGNSGGYGPCVVTIQNAIPAY